jgi:hypothetical protein
MSNIAPSFSDIQVESVQFNQPVSESSLTGIGGSVNGALQNAATSLATLTGFNAAFPVLYCILPVGSIVDTMLDELTFNAQMGKPSPATWVIPDGRAVPGSVYASLISANVPDIRGAFTRMQDQGRGLDPNGNQVVGTYIPDQFASHTHNVVVNTAGTPAAVGGSIAGSFATPGAASTVFGHSPLLNSLTGGTETAPKYIVVNKMIRIN